MPNTQPKNKRHLQLCAAIVCTVLLLMVGSTSVAAAQPLPTDNDNLENYVQNLADDVVAQGNLFNETAARLYILEQQSVKLTAQVEDLRLQNQALVDQLQQVRQSGSVGTTAINVRTSSWWVAVLAVLWGLSF